MSTAINALINFIEKSPTAFHAVASCAEILEEKGYQRLCEQDAWDLQAGKGYYLTRNQSSIIAFRIPKGTPHNFLVAASHTDSPMFKLKSEALSPAFDQYLRLNTEPYGGTIFSTWLDRPLSLAGRVIVSNGDKIEARLVNIARDLLVIPNVAIHMKRDINSSCAYNPAIDLLPLLSQDVKTDFGAFLAAEAGCKKEELLGYDLYVYNRTPATRIGVDGEFFSAPRIDNLMSVFGTLQGFVKSENADAVDLFYAADNEETGSSTKQGAGSVFLSDVIDRICETIGIDRRRALASSMLLSADNAHAKHPNHPELSDAKNAPHMNGGVVIKNNAAQKYTTDGISSSILKEICAHAGVPTQEYANRSDMPGGSTLGSIATTLTPMLSVDIGMAQLAMHSAYETAGSLDIDHLINASKAFYSTALTVIGDGQYRLQFPKRKGARKNV
ncbi:MAG: M18 family aminopeptidase [Ruminococcaceae bacterium]|nr:M18 family aminopeptidase [Oscillospiraceae bacterium]